MPDPLDLGGGDPVAARSPGLVWLFRVYLHWYFWRRFHGVRLSRAGIPACHAGRPVVVYMNHPSWWDPALLLLVSAKIFPGRAGFGPMDAAELRRYAVFRRMGVFGIDPGTATGAARFLAVARLVLSRPDTVLCVTAEGAFTDSRRRPVILRRGVAHLARRMPDAVFLPLAVEYGFWNESKPEALLRFGAPVEPGERSTAEWQGLLEARLEQTMSALAQESIGRNPALFVELLGGTAGVGGVYDLYRRARSALGGAPFEARHDTGRR